MLDVPESGTAAPEPQIDAKQSAKTIWQSRLLILSGLLVGFFGVVALLPKSPPAPEKVAAPLHSAATDHVPFFIAQPGSSDVLLNVMAVVLILVVLGAGVFFFWLHSLPERMVHNSTKLHVDIVAVLGLLSLFTHINAFWVAGLLLALLPMPDLSASYIGRLTRALEKLAGVNADPDPKQAQQTSDHVKH